MGIYVFERGVLVEALTKDAADAGSRHSIGNLYNDRWPILTRVPAQPPAKFVHDDGDRAGRAVNSAVSNGVIVSGGLVRNSVLSPGPQIDSWSRVDRAVNLHNCRISRVRGLAVSSGGITAVGSGQVVPS